MASYAGGGEAKVAVCSYQGCSKNVFVDTRTGIAHDFCGRSHALLAGALQPEQPPHGICHVCKLLGCNRTVAFDEATGRVHDFCCR